MEKKIYKCLLTLSVGGMVLGLASCGDDNVIHKPPIVENDFKATLKEAVASTRSTYTMKYNYMDVKDKFRVVEMSSDNLFYYMINSLNYIILDDDPEYVHRFTVDSSVVEGYNVDTINVHGRSGFKSYLDTAKDNNFFKVLDPFLNDFTIDESVDGKWGLESSTATKAFSNYFQLNTIKYCTYTEFIVGDDDKLSSVGFYEVNGEEKALALSIDFINYNINDFDAYTNWVKEGKVINNSIFDYKNGAKDSSDKYVGFYENQNISLKGYVTSIDSSKNIYIAADDISNGPVGIKATLKSTASLPSIGDEITLNGKLIITDSVATLVEASFVKTGITTKYPPYYDEEAISQAYGGGAYAAMMFGNSTFYSGSIYSTYGYIEEALSEFNEGEDIIATISFPYFTKTNDNGITIPLTFRLVIPKDISYDSKKMMFDNLDLAGIRSNEGYELLLDKVVYINDSKEPNGSYLLATESSTITKNLSFEEKCGHAVGLPSINLPLYQSASCYKFGGGTGMNLESLYTRDAISDPRQGYYLLANILELETVYAYNDYLLSIGLNFVDRYKDLGGGKHFIFSNGINNVDITYSSNDYGGGSGYNVEIRFYQGDVIYGETINSLIKDNASFFSDEFSKLSGTHDSSYTMFNFESFAGNVFSKANPLTCITLDLDEEFVTNYKGSYGTNDPLFDYIRYYSNVKGFELVKNSDGSMYTYKTRGKDHYILKKGSKYIDFASYPTTDYTYNGHSEFLTRIELLVYEGTEPLKSQYVANLNEFNDNLTLEYGNEKAKINVTFKNNEVVETYQRIKESSYIEYGYCYAPSCFIYTSNVDLTYDNLVSDIIASGYKFSHNGKKSAVYTKDDAYYLCVMKFSDRGVIEVIGSINGRDF